MMSIVNFKNVVQTTPKEIVQEKLLCDRLPKNLQQSPLQTQLNSYFQKDSEQNSINFKAEVPKYYVYDVHDKLFIFMNE